MAIMTGNEEQARAAWVIRTVLAAGVLALSVAVFAPFASPVLWAGVLCYALYPLYTRLVRATGNRRGSAH